MNGDVQFSPSGETQWDRANRNRPLVTGDRLLTGGNARAALELGDSAVRIDANSAFNVLSLDDRTTQIQLSQGTLNLRVRTMNAGQNYEVDTPLLAFVADRPGDYRIEVTPNGRATIVTVAEGSATVYGENGVSRVLSARRSYQFDDTRLGSVTDRGSPAADDFDRYSAARDDRYSNSGSRRHVSSGVIGYDDLDDNGDWEATSDYGQVWYPSHVAPNWAPYRDGQWQWVDPYGWTWVDNAPWGFAPYHYGRWVRIHDRWGWLPGSPVERAVYAPALVAFVGPSNRDTRNRNGDEPVGWFPLGPRDVYVPPYQVSRDYFTNVNVTNISVSNKTIVNNTVINNYYDNSTSPNAAQQTYAYSTTPQAVTVVPRGVFIGALPVAAAAIAMQPAALTGASVASNPHVAPGAASLGLRGGAQSSAVPNGAFDRIVVARNAPPPPPVPFATREKLIATQHGAPVAVQQLRQLQQARAEGKTPPQRIRLATPGTTATTGPGAPPNGNPATVAPGAASAPPAGPTAPGIGHAPPAPDANGSPADRAAQARLMAQRLAQDRAAKAADARAAQVQAQNAAAQERAAKMNAQKAAATEHAAQLQQAKLAAAQQHAAQMQQAQNAAAQAQAAKMKAASAAADEHAAQLQQAKLAAAQQHAAQMQQAQNAAAQAQAAKMKAQSAAADETPQSRE